MTSQRPIVIGTRGSPLALIQAEAVKSRLGAAHDGLTSRDIEIRVFRTSGDRIRDKPLREFGGKGLFTKEIEEAMLAGDIHLGVHSCKDLPTELPAGLHLGCLLPREDPRDAFVSPDHKSLAALPPGAVVGTSSLRRRAQIRYLRDDLDVVEFRGNVDTRLKKLADGLAEATLLACAGLNRLGRGDLVREAIAPEVMLPAAAQGAIGVECRTGDEDIAALLAPLNDADTAICISAERAFLAALDGSCRTPIAALAQLDGDEIHFRGEILTPDGRTRHQGERRGAAATAAAIGREAGEALKALAGPGFFQD